MQENLHHLNFPRRCICDCCSLSAWARLVPTPHLDANTMPYFQVTELPYSTGKAKPMSTLWGEVLIRERGVFGFACGGHVEAANPKRNSRIRPELHRPKMKETGWGGGGVPLRTSGGLLAGLRRSMKAALNAVPRMWVRGTVVKSSWKYMIIRHSKDLS